MSTTIKLLTIVAIIFAIHFSAANAQYDTLSSQNIPKKIQELSEGNLKDSILISTIGFWRDKKMRFNSISENTIYVNNVGIYYKLDFRDDKDNLVISMIYFKPHFKKFIPTDTNELKNLDADYVYAPNEHICNCEAKIGYAKAIRVGDEFQCKGVKPEWEDSANVTVHCYDAEDINIYIKKHYAIGAEYIDKLTSIAPLKILPFKREEIEQK